MQTQLILTIVSDDKPGIVETIARCIKNHQGNWLDSQLAQLSGKFAGVITCSVPQDQVTALESELKALKQSGIQVASETLDQTTTSAPSRTAQFSATGPDRPGIVQEITRAFATKDINLVTLHTQLSSMPYSGEPLFEARGKISVPVDIDLPSLSESIDDIADSLGVDFALNED